MVPANQIHEVGHVKWQRVQNKRYWQQMDQWFRSEFNLLQISDDFLPSLSGFRPSMGHQLRVADGVGADFNKAESNQNYTRSIDLDQFDRDLRVNPATGKDIGNDGLL